MIQVILLILKIIGIAVLVILGLLLLVLALVLFVPVFYRIRVIHTPDKTQVKGRVSFLFPLVLVTAEYLKKITYKVRLLGIALLDSEKPKKEKKEKKPKQKKTKQVKKEKKKNKKSKMVDAKASAHRNESVSEPVAGNIAEPAKEAAVEHTENVQPERKEQLPDSTKKQGFFEKIRVKLQKIRETISNIIKKIRKLLHLKEEVQRILAKQETKHALAFAWEELKHLLKHVLPGKIKGYVVYGADNPATTGQVLGILSVVYARTGMLLEIRPNFEEKQLECNVELKGRIQVFALLVIAVKVFMNQELKQLIGEFQGLKEIE